MKYFVYIVVFMVLLKPVFPVFDYMINYEYISKVLCENKAKPVLKCNGKCHLMKQLAKESETEKPINSDKKGFVFSDELFFQDLNFKCYKEPLFFISNNHSNFKYFNFYSFLKDYSVFHPPSNFYNSIV